MNQKNNRKKMKWLGVLSFLLVIIFFTFLIKGNLLNNFLRPAMKIFANAGGWMADKKDFIFSIGQLKRENEDLLQASLRAQAELAELKDVEKENEQLRKNLDLKLREEYDSVGALVLGKEISGQKQVLTIDKGKRDDLKEGAAVITNEGLLVGKIVELSETTAKVQLLIDRESKVNVEIVESGTQGVITSRFGTSAKVEMLERTETINPGDTVISSGLGETLPRGLLVGYVKEVSETADQLFQEATVIFPQNFKKLRLVLVIK
ncbi:MAG: rod shape-determining protein MreC [Acidobacteria bacterium]|nr:MAG: rod shape-determining protein MreC [Acidobacteriota bacterium]